MSDNPSAFPVSEIGTHGQFGMTLRDWFAGQALAGLFSNGYRERSVTATDCYNMADAMLAARTGDA